MTIKPSWLDRVIRAVSDNVNRFQPEKAVGSAADAAIVEKSDSDIPRYIAIYLRELHARCVSPYTIRAYTVCLDLFARFAAARPLSTDLLLEYAEALYARRGLARASIGTYLGHVYTWARWCARRGAAIDVSRLRARRAAGGIKALTVAQIFKAFKATPRGTRFMIAFLLDSGLRVSELVGCRARDFSEVDGVLSVVVIGKGGRIRRVGLGHDLAAATRARLAELGADDLLFPLTVEGVRTRLKRASRLCGFSILPHRWRHSWAQQACARGASAGLIQAALGHATPTMSLHYARLYSNQAAAAQSALSPVDGMGIEL